MYTQTVNSTAFIPVLAAMCRKLNFGISRLKIVLPFLLVFSFVNTYAPQDNDTAYQRVLHERSAKIVAGLGIEDTIISNKVTKQIAKQYYQLNAIHDNSKVAVAAIKAKNLPKEETDAAIKAEGDKKSSELKQLHAHFLALLEKRLTPTQIEKVKDGMTYRVLPVTWAAYMDMLQNLTPEQKDKMYAWLVEARELAMDEGSSDAKHAVFGKYKGRINNYLSAAGYDMKKEGEEWQKRIEAAKKAKQKTN
jgi:hypothetical protein